MKKLYTVTIETEIGVIAETEEEAEEAARDALDELPSFDYDIYASPMRELPKDWDGSALPFGENEPERTIDQWVEAGAGEELRKAREEWQEFVVRRMKVIQTARALQASAPDTSDTGQEDE